MTKQTARPSGQPPPPTSPESPGFSWAVPEELGVPVDPLRLRLDFHHQATVMTMFQGDIASSRLVDAADVAHTLASELTFSSGLLPLNTLWWGNNRGGPLYALYEAPRTRILALQGDIKKPPVRFTLPLPGFIFLCRPGRAPWIYAVQKKPSKENDIVYHAPLANIFANGRSCPGSHKYPVRIADIVESFFTSFFSATADLRDRSVKYPKNILGLWKFLDKKKQFPMNDLVKFGTVKDLMTMETRD